MHSDDQDALLWRHLQALLGPIEPATRAWLAPRLQWLTLARGARLMTQGDPGDALYVAISGRLRASVRGDDGQPRRVREMGRGQVIGEMSLFTDEVRSATVDAVRDSVLVRLDKATFRQLLTENPHSAVMLTRQLIRRLQQPPNPAETARADRPVVLALMPVTPGIDAAGFARRLADALGRALRAATPQAAGGGNPPRIGIVDAAALDAVLGTPGLADSTAADADPALQRRIGLALDSQEAAHDVLLLLSDGSPTPWTQRCIRSCDELLLLADADAPPRLSEAETRFLADEPSADGRATGASCGTGTRSTSGATDAVSQTLVLLHPDDRRSPQHTARWLARRPLGGTVNHLHIRPGLDRDLGRLARLMTGTAVGLVLAGGGARGLAHLGVLQALQARGVEVDVVGGTSIGAVMAALVALDRPLDETLQVARRAFGRNPTGDFNWLPMVSLIAGRRLRAIVGEAVQALAGHDAAVEDLWKTFYCVASNYTQAREQVITRGPLQRALLASIAIPGALPPVLHEGELLCDGGTFNNFPVDRMRDLPGVGRVLGVDLSQRSPRKLDLQEIPGTWALLRDRLRGRRRRYRLPSLVSYLMNVTILYSTSRQRQAQALTDLYFNPPLHKVGMLQWERFDSIVDQGRAHAEQVLGALPDAVGAGD
jgi:NTE family protein